MSKNEKITESLVRKKLEALGYYGNSNILVEEQIIQNPFINKLLPSKSKIGKGKGKPEFLISNSDNVDYLIVIECKADVKYHESKNGNQFAEYAIDGVLLYASCLSKGYNVIAIAVSGQNEKELKIDTFIHPKGSQKATPLKDNSKKPVLIKEFVQWKDYIRYAQYDENLTVSRKNDLNRFSKELHNYLRDYGKITVAQMPLLVSGVLIALMEKGFKVAYSKYEESELAQKTFQAIKDEIGKAKLGINQEKKKEAIINAFSFIEYHPELQKKDKKRNESPLAHIVREIDSEMKPFTQDHFDFDIIGDFYGEFIRYTGGDAQGLGIVLTPKHITELFADLAKLNKNSVVLDTCCGTAGFLIAAMNKMINGVGETERANILENSLIGVEQEPSMFALAVSNMILRGDGKTNLYQGSCFDEEILKQIENKATVGFMNPPYSQKGEDLHEWNFIIQLLDALQKNAIGIVIVPMGLAVSKHPLREQLLKEHRLEAVMSMPDDLFYPVGVVPCIMVFTAHVPHDSDQHHESWFGYWKNDGFKKIKKEGRVATDKWPKIRESWIDMYRKKEIPGKSVWKKVGANEEWLAEVYLETDYSTIRDDDFKDAVLNYAAFMIKNGNLSLIKIILNQKNKKISLSNREWTWFAYPEVFDIAKGHYNNRPEIDEKGIPFISATENNNGITDYVTKDGTKIFSAKSITVSNDGSVGNAFYQENEFTCSHSVNVIRLNKKYNKELNQYLAFFLIPLIQKEKYRFGYGFKWRIERMKESKIKLPVDVSGNPDWKFMEEYIKSLPYSAEI